MAFALDYLLDGHHTGPATSPLSEKTHGIVYRRNRTIKTHRCKMNRYIYLSACLRINAQSLLEALHHLPHVVARQLLHGVQAGLAVHALHHKISVHLRLLHGPVGVIFQVPESKLLGLPKCWR